MASSTQQLLFLILTTTGKSDLSRTTLYITKATILILESFNSLIIYNNFICCSFIVQCASLEPIDGKAGS